MVATGIGRVPGDDGWLDDTNLGDGCSDLAVLHGRCSGRGDRTKRHVCSIGMRRLASQRKLDFTGMPGCVRSRQGLPCDQGAMRYSRAW